MNSVREREYNMHDKELFKNYDVDIYLSTVFETKTVTLMCDSDFTQIIFSLIELFRDNTIECEKSDKVYYHLVEIMRTMNNIK